MRVVHERQDSGLLGPIAPVLLGLVQGLVGRPDEIGRRGLSLIHISEPTRPY